MQKFLLVYYHSENRATSQIWKILPKVVFPRFGEKNWRRSEHAHASYSGLILDSSFARAGSALIWGGKKEEFRDWTSVLTHLSHLLLRTKINIFIPLSTPSLLLSKKYIVYTTHKQANSTT